MQRNFLIIVGIFLLLELYIYQAIRTLTNNFWIKTAYWAVSLTAYGIFTYEIINIQKGSKNPMKFHLLISIFTIVILPKILIILFLLIDDIVRIATYLFGFTKPTENFFPERRKFLSLVGLGLGGVLSALFIDGITFGKYRHTVRRVKIKLSNLPKSFKGYKIIQISDVHSGSFSDPSKLEHAIELINKQKPDLVLFTGDMVNNIADEFKPFILLFSKIKAKDGKFAVLGNHDYGDYVTWSSPEEKKQNLETLIDYERQAGFDILRNENRIIEKNGEKLYILGVENWGEKPFPQFGKIDDALKNVPESAPKILLSHDPTHFDHIVKKHPANIQLTLSGHTHGMQFGIDLKNIKWSPSQYRYPKWADLYESEGKLLYVNRGFGVIGYPGRVGVLPEITLFELS
ncbi:metallophosphoesterase [Chryseobacterium oryctis]|uniref:Metallophosphoesterase n=1 Tax=Chryseobacterium oryctis TaxID=2952618 RepID=A0ABT3HS15_9FLAO|nr:metallophosphoesterase [Chryseobacterium oryctis]MCW3162556.1 metallophosphoesterase [Chryseobacterium oryctis]